MKGLCTKVYPELRGQYRIVRPLGTGSGLKGKGRRWCGWKLWELESWDRGLPTEARATDACDCCQKRSKAGRKAVAWSGEYVNLGSLPSAFHWPHPIRSQRDREPSDAVIEDTEGKEQGWEGMVEACGKEPGPKSQVLPGLSPILRGKTLNGLDLVVHSH